MEPTINPNTPAQEPMTSTPPMQAMPQQAPVMNTTPITSAPMTPPVAPPMSAMAPKKSSFGPLIGAVIIILILIAGALYFWSPLLMPAQPTDTTSTAQVSDNTDTIGADSQVSAATASVDALQGDSMEADLNTLSQ